ncbi:MAG: methylated-DNA--[protein]-cysteine S-methyltransferase [bacterium]|nr:methylated-DNA--[protein]-cysteine S-methyltransferase [bacterium]
MPTTTLYLPTRLGTFTLKADDAGLSSLLFPEEAEQEGLISRAGSVEGAGVTTLATSTAPETASPLLQEAARQVLAYLNGRLFQFDLPLSYGGTAFQRQVWQGLLAIPYGETMSYGELAAKIGNRNKARAVGGAAHVNPIGIIIPCHRLIGASGSLTGFGGGLAMKETLLAMERKHRRK